MRQPASPGGLTCDESHWCPRSRVGVSELRVSAGWRGSHLLRDEAAGTSGSPFLRASQGHSGESDLSK